MISKTAPAQLLVKFKPQAKYAARISTHTSVGARVLRYYDHINGLQLAEIPADIPLPKAIAAYREDPAVEYVEPNFRVKAFGSTPNDAEFAKMFGLQNTGQDGGKAGADINVVPAWALTTGDSNLVVAVIDTGVDYTHPDLAANIFQNTTDCNSNGVDDDADGYADDCHGIAPVNKNSDPMDDAGHGTHVAGTIGAVGNNEIGTVGVNWNVTLLPCKFLNSQGGGTVADAVACLDYIAGLKDRGVNIVATHNSWEGISYSQALYDAIKVQMQKGILFIAAAGNDFTDDDVFPVYPANYDLPNIISVAATNRYDELAHFSNLGRHTVGLGAPGDLILSTYLGGGYELLSGTSMSSPHVTGVAALLKAQNPARDWKQIKNLILAGGRTIPALAETISGNALDAYGAMTCSSSTVSSRLQPALSTMTATAGQPVTIRYLNINCGQAVGNVTINVPETSETVTLVDDGAGADLATGDGVFSGQWTPPSQGSYTLKYPDSDDVHVLVLESYAPVESTASYQSISGTSLDLGDDDVATIPAPFPVQFGGGKFSKLYVSSNGIISFTNQFSQFVNDLLPVRVPSIGTLIAPYWDDLYAAKGTSHNVFYDVIGTAPNRQFVIEWRDLQNFQCRFDPSATVKFQVVFNEDDSNVAFNYADTVLGGECSYLDHGFSSTIGIQTGVGQATRWSVNYESIADGTSILWQTGATLPGGVPTVTSVSPSTFSVGSPESTITVNGTGFGFGSQVEVDLSPRATTFISSTQLQAVLPASDFQDVKAGSHSVAVHNRGPGGGRSPSVWFTVTDKSPVIYSISPTSVVAGSFGFTLEIDGENFAYHPGLKANDQFWSYNKVSSSLIYAYVPASMIANSGTIHISIDNGEAGVSNTVDLTVTAAAGASSYFAPSILSSREMLLPKAPLGSVRFRGWNYLLQHDQEHAQEFLRFGARVSEKFTTLNQPAGMNSFTSAGNSSLPGLAMRESLPAGFIPTGVAAGDFNRDGLMDWVVTNGGTSDLWVYFGKGDGTAQVPRIIRLSGSGPVWITTADLRHNGILDLIVAEADSGSIGVLLGNGDGTFQPEHIWYVFGAPLFLTAVDVNSDGVLDIVASLAGTERVAVTLPGSGDGSFQAPKYTVTPFGSPAETLWLAVGDLDGDSFPDIAVADPGAGLYLYSGRGDGTFKFSTEIESAFFQNFLTANIADFNGDGCTDIVSTNAYHNAKTYFGHCDGTFTLKDNGQGMGDDMGSAIVADVNGDGKPDLIASGGSGSSGSGATISVLLSDGKGNFANPQLYRGELSGYGVATADVNGDGKLDVLTANQDSDSVSVFLNQGSGVYGAPLGEYIGIVGTRGGAINSTTSDLMPVDINGDGKTDLAFQNIVGGTLPNTLDVVLNDGSGHFSSLIYSPLFDWTFANAEFAFGDFRNVGHPDVVAVGFDIHRESTYITYAEGNGDGTFALPTRIPFVNADRFATGDFNADGKLDFVVVNYVRTNEGQQKELFAFIGNGDGTFTSSSGIPFAINLSGITDTLLVGDFNGDGKLDIIARNYLNQVPFTANDLYLFLGNGDGSFQAPVIAIPNSDPVAISDLNHDGVTDIVEYRDPSSDFLVQFPIPKIIVHLGQKSGEFAPPVTYQPYSGYELFGNHLADQGNVNPTWLADFDGDGNLDVAVFLRYSFGVDEEPIQFLKGNGDGTFTPTYTNYKLHSLAYPRSATDLNGDGKADMIETDRLSSSFNVIPGALGAQLQAKLLSDPVVGNSGTVRLIFATAPLAGTTIALASSDPNIAIPESVNSDGALTQDVVFTIGSGFVNDHVFSLQATVAGYTATAYGTVADRSAHSNFLLTMQQTSESVAPGGTSYDYGVFVTSVNGASSTVTLSCSGLPAGAKCNFGQNPVSVPAGSFVKTTMVIETTYNTAEGSYQVTVNAALGGAVAASTVTLEVRGFYFHAQSDQTGAFPTSTATYRFDVGPSPGFNGTIQYRCAGLPAAATCAFTTGSQLATLNVSLDHLVEGDYQFNVIATSGSFTQTAQLLLKVWNFTSNTTNVNTTLAVGSSTTTPLTVSPLNGFSGTVVLSCTSTSVLVQCSIDAASVSLNGSTPRTINVTIKATGRPSAEPGSPVSMLWLVPFGGIAAIVIPSVRSRNRYWIYSGLAISLLVALISCGGGGGNGGGTGPITPPPPSQTGSATITVQGQSYLYAKTLASIKVTVP